jgi:hypothetical protein
MLEFILTLLNLLSGSNPDYLQKPGPKPHPMPLPPPGPGGD